MEPAPQLQYPLLDAPETNALTVPAPSAPALPSEPACQHKKCWCVSAFIPLQLIVIIVQIVALSSSYWLQYCFWNFGLVYGDETDHHSQFDKSGTGFSLQDEYCHEEDQFLSEPINQYCPLFCVNIWILIAYGLVALVLGIVAIATAIIPLVLHCLVLRKELEISYVHWLTLIPAKFWTLAWVLFYAGTLGLHMNMHQEHQERQEHQETQVGCAFWLALAGSLGQLALFFYVFFGTSKAFVKANC